jgi:alkanesulfonate monooxygenase
MTQRQLKLGAFIQATGHHIAAWRHPGSQADSGANIDHYRQVAQIAERGRFPHLCLSRCSCTAAMIAAAT